MCPCVRTRNKTKPPQCARVYSMASQPTALQWLQLTRAIRGRGRPADAVRRLPCDTQSSNVPGVLPRGGCVSIMPFRSTGCVTLPSPDLAGDPACSVCVCAYDSSLLGTTTDRRRAVNGMVRGRVRATVLETSHLWPHVDYRCGVRRPTAGLGGEWLRSRHRPRTLGTEVMCGWAPRTYLIRHHRRTRRCRATAYPTAQAPAPWGLGKTSAERQSRASSRRGATPAHISTQHRDLAMRCNSNQ